MQDYSSNCGLDDLIARQSNTCLPSPVEHQLVTREIDRINEEIDALDDEIARMNAIRCAKSASVGELQSVIAPHKKLPTEILALIFQHTLSNHHNPAIPFAIPTMISRKSSPWNLRHVCSSWRRVALTRNTLWNNIVLEWTVPDQDSGGPIYRWERRLEITKQILPQVGPLNIEIHSEDGMEVATTLLKHALSFIKPYKDRVSALGFRSKSTFLAFSALFLEEPIAFPILERFSMVSLYTHEQWEQDDARDVFKHKSIAFFNKTPHLHNLTLSGDSFVLRKLLRLFDDPPIHDQLTHLDLTYDESPEDGTASLAWNPLRRALEQCTKLKVLALRMHAELHFERAYTSSHVTLPELESLTLYTVEPLVFQTFILPSLSYLCYKSSTHFRTNDLIALIKRSRCSLKTFVEFTHLNAPDRAQFKRDDWDELVAILHGVKELQTITLLDHQDLERLGQGQILPNVETLHIHVDPKAAPKVFGELKDRLAGNVQAGCSRIRAVDVVYRPQTLFPDLEEQAGLKRDEAAAHAMGSLLKFRLTGRERYRRKTIVRVVGPFTSHFRIFNLR